MQIASSCCAFESMLELVIRPVNATPIQIQ